MTRKSVPLPSALIPFLVKNLDWFDATLEDGERIVITRKAGALPSAPSWSQLQSELLQKVITEHPRARTTALLRPKFTYMVSNKAYTPHQGKTFGMSKPRLKVYEIIHAAGDIGVGYRGIRDTAGLPHGSVMQILFWLRTQGLITGSARQRTTVIVMS